jgi:hypothetical protein
MSTADPPTAPTTRIAAELGVVIHRVDAYLGEHAAYREPGCIAGYCDGNGLIHTVLWASDVHALLTAVRHVHSPAASRAPTTERTTDMGADTRRRQHAEDVITRAWPGQRGERLLAALGDDEAFGALAWRIEQTHREGVDPVDTLRDLGVDTLDWVIDEATNPAAFLASRLADTTGDAR